MKKVARITIDQTTGSVEYSQSQLNGLDLISFGAVLIRDVAEHIHVSEEEIADVMIQLIHRNEEEAREEHPVQNNFN